MTAGQRRAPRRPDALEQGYAAIAGATRTPAQVERPLTPTEGLTSQRVSHIKAWSSLVDIATMTMVRVAEAPVAARAVATRPAPAASARMQRPAPQRSAELAHMSLEQLRAYRRRLMGEELRASYWRRLLQARRDLARLGELGGDLDLLRMALTEERAVGGRNAILALHPEGGMPVLPQLPELWAAEGDSALLVDGRDLTARLASAESVLSSYREALHRRLDRATADLVARYHADPTLCLSALPLAG